MTQQSKIHGPVTGGRHGWAFARPLIDLAARGFVEEEFFLSGEATTYAQAPGAEWGRDGKWRVEPKGDVPFKTRILVYRPADAAKFNHIVGNESVTAGDQVQGAFRFAHAARATQ